MALIVIFFNGLIVVFDGLMGLLISFGCGFGVEFQWWIVETSVWWAVGCGGTVGLGLSLVGLLGGSSGSACVVDGGSMGFFFFFWVFNNLC